MTKISQNYKIPEFEAELVAMVNCSRAVEDRFSTPTGNFR
jgi:hypothetical protein